jgi:hypothetical protein
VPDVSGVSPQGQTSFAGGELSKRLHGRIEAPLYGSGLDLCENFKPTPQGSLLGRGGSYFMDSAPAGATRARFIEFRSASQDDYLLVLTNLRLRIYSILGQAGGGGELGVVAGPWDALDSDGAAYASASGGSGSVQSGEYLDTEIQPPRYRTLVGSVSRTLTLENPGTLLLSFYVDASAFSVKLTGGAGVTYLSNGMSGLGQRSYEIPLPSGVFTLKFTSTSTSAKGQFSGLAYSVGGIVETDKDTPWNDDALWDVQFVPDTSIDRVLFAHPKYPPQMLTLAGWAFAEIPLVSAPVEWGQNGAYPGVLEIFSGRLWFAMGRRVWASKSGDLFDFGKSDPTVTSDRIDVKVATKGKITWLQSQKVLLIGTDLGEHSVLSASGVVSSLDIDVAPESAFGSAPMQALHVGNQVLWVTRDRKHIRALSFSRDVDGWVSQALTFVAEHLTRDGIKELHFAKSPDPVLFVLLQTGELRACTYDRSQEVIAWWRLSFGGTIETIAVSEGAGGSDLWIAVRRFGGLYIERNPQYEDTAVYLDSAVTAVVPASGVLSGLDHLEGALVRVVVAGAVEGEDIVVAGGQVALDVATSPELVGLNSVVGLPFRSKAVTLPREGGRKRRNVRAVLRLNDSAIPLVDGVRAAPTRSPATPMGSVEPGVSADIECTLLGWGDGSITIEQDLPLRTEILALFANTAVYDI